MRNELFRHTIRYGCVMAVLTVCLSSGCAQFNIKETFSNPFKSEDNDPHLPARVLAVWVDTIRYTQGEAPTRGFGGRIMFYKHGEEKPVKVEGDLVVYAFDEDDRKPADPRPTRKYVFRADQMEAHYSKSKVGHSYNFFIPWDNVGGTQKDISLIVRFQPKLGPVIASEQTRHLLPGKPKLEETQLAEPSATSVDAETVRAASFQSENLGGLQEGSNREGMKTTTISLPSKFGQQTPRAAVRPRYTRPRTRALAQAVQGLPLNQNSQTRPSADSQPSESRPPASQGARQARGRAQLTRHLAGWRPPRQSSLPSASDSESN